MKWIIFWNTGYGESADIIEAESEEKAQEAAYEAWRDEAENNADYRVEPYTKQAAVENGLEDGDESQ